MQTSGYLALHAALVRHVFSDRYPRLSDAVDAIMQWEALGTAESHAAELAWLINELGGHDALSNMIAEYTAAASGAITGTSVLTGASSSCMARGESSASSAVSAACAGFEILQ